MTLAVKLNGYNYNIKSEIKSEKEQARSGVTQLKDYLGTANGAYKCADLPSKICKLGTEISLLAKNPAAASTFKGPGAVFSNVSGAFILPYCAFSAIKLKESIEIVNQKNGATGVNIETVAKDALTLVNSFCYSALLFVPSKLLNSVATVTGFGSDGIELKQEACNWSETADMQGADGLTDEMSTKLAEKKKNHLFGLIKAVASVVSGLFAVLALILSAAVVPAVVSAVLGMVAISFTFIKQFYGDSLDRKISFERGGLISPTTLPIDHSIKPATA